MNKNQLKSQNGLQNISDLLKARSAAQRAGTRSVPSASLHINLSC